MRRMIVLTAARDRLRLAVLQHGHDARLALGVIGPGTGPVRPIARHLILCETKLAYLQLATPPVPSHVAQAAQAAAA